MQTTGVLKMTGSARGGVFNAMSAYPFWRARHKRGKRMPLSINRDEGALYRKLGMVKKETANGRLF